VKQEQQQVESDGDENYFTVERILDKKKEGKRVFYKVKWVGYPEDQCTWEPLANLWNVKKMLKDYENEQEFIESMQQSTATQNNGSSLEKPSTKVSKKSKAI